MVHAVILLTVIICGLLLLVPLIVYAIYRAEPGRMGYVALPKAVVPVVVAALDIGPGDTVCDLGCGDGKVIALALTKNPSARGLAIEVSPPVYIIARLRLLAFGSRVAVIRGDILTQDLSSVRRVFAYLNDPTMAALEAKLEKQLAKGSRLVSCDFPLPSRKATKTIQLGRERKLAKTLYVYDY